MDTSTFLKRSLTLQGELQKKGYPNASTLAAMCDCSRSTAMRTIDRMRYEFGVPLEYDQTKRGYYLTNSKFSFLSLPPGRDELVAIILLSKIARMVDDTSLLDALSALWARISNGRSDVYLDLEPLREKFSFDMTSIAKLANINLVQLLTFCHTGQLVVIRYRSPWSHNESEELGGILEHLHLSDGIFYARFKDERGRHFILNLSFIEEIREVADISSLPTQVLLASQTNPHCFEGFGIWAGSNPEMIEITIAAAASNYYGAQIWHLDQEDSWNGDSLVRSFPGTVSPELIRRILSLGRFVIAVKPGSLLEQLHEDARHLMELCAVESGVRAPFSLPLPRVRP